MSGKKIIAVAGATGAQGGGLVRSILAEKDGEFAVRAITRDPSSPQARALAAAGAEVVARGHRRHRGGGAGLCRRARRLLRDVLLEPFLARPGAGRSPLAGRCRAAGRSASRHLVDARGLASVGRARRPAHADADGQLQGAALRREGRDGRVLPRDRRADHLPADLVLLGQPDPLRHGPEGGPRRPAVLRAADGRAAVARHRGGRHRPLRARDLQARRASSPAGRSASPAST